MGIDAAIIHAHLIEVSSAPNTDAQGRAYEALVAYIFGEVPGCRVERDVMNEFRTEQVDVAVGNDRVPGGFPMLPSVMLAECKDWSRPVDSATMGYFINTLANRSVELGVLVAANGITGQEDRMHAAALGYAAASRGIKLIVLTTEDLGRLKSTADFIDMLSRRYLRAVASGTVGLP